MAAVAAHKGIAPQRLEANVQRSTVQGESWHTTFEVQIDPGEGLNKRERTILFNSARRCEVHKLLAGEIRFTYTVAEPTAGEEAGEGPETDG
jgi:hypothetical protein